MRRRLLIEAGGHSPRFEGHGAEDFELMHRLAARRPRGALPDEYWRDFGSRDRGRAGFRAYFARYAEGPLAEGLVMAHLWHPQRREDPRYYGRRRENFALLETELRRAAEARAPAGEAGAGPG
jgi:predicted glycosyltransferase involved in capsule biosynthesis